MAFGWSPPHQLDRGLEGRGPAAAWYGQRHAYVHLQAYQHGTRPPALTGPSLALVPTPLTPSAGPGALTIQVWVCPKCGNYYGASSAGNLAEIDRPVSRQNGQRPGSRGKRSACPICPDTDRNRHDFIVPAGDI